MGYSERINPFNPVSPKIQEEIEEESETQEVEEKPETQEEDPLTRYLRTQFDNIVSVTSAHLKANDDKSALESALAEVEFYKQLIADAKVAWTKAIPHDLSWNDMIDLGTILSRTP